MRNEIVKMTDAEYFAADGLSNSFMKLFDRSPAHAMTGIKETDSMKKGTMIHCWLLEPDQFFDRYVVLPEGMKKGNSNKYKEFKADNPEKEIIYQADVEDMECIENNIPILYRNFFKKEKTEMAMFWGELVGEELVQMKAKLDCPVIDDALIIDVKATDDCTRFAKAIANYGYFRQDAHYSKGFDILFGQLPDFEFLVVEKTAPFGIMIYTITPQYRAIGERLNMLTKHKFIKWNGEEKLYSEETQIIGVPNWMEV